MAYHLEVSPYQLQAKRMLNRFGNSKVEGVLLKFLFTDGAIGYSSLQAWPELGDYSLAEEILALVNKRPLALGTRSLEFARIDADARHQQKKLYLNLKVTNHYTLGVPEITAIPTCFTHVKIKLSASDLPSFKKQEWLKQYNLRIDFNRSLSIFDNHILVESLAGFNIDFLEDAGNFKNSFTNFYDEVKQDHQNWVIKPAKETLTENDSRILFTSYMDHPINQVHATIVASNFYQANPNKQEICGLRTDLLFTDNSYLDYFAKNTNELHLQEDGYGIGFTTLLEKEKWQIFRG